MLTSCFSLCATKYVCITQSHKYVHQNNAYSGICHKLDLHRHASHPQEELEHLTLDDLLLSKSLSLPQTPCQLHEQQLLYHEQIRAPECNGLLEK